MAWYDPWIDEVASVFVAVVVSKAVQSIGPKLGLSDSVTGVAAVLGGAYAGRATHDYMNTSPSGDAAGAGDANQVGMDLNQPTQGASTSLAGSDAAPSGPGSPGLSLTPGQNSGRPGDAGPGMTNTGAPAPAPLQMSSDPNASAGMLPPKPAPPPPPPGAGAEIVSAGTTGTPPTPKKEKSWFEKLMANDKVWDMAMAGMAGAGEAGIRKTEMEYPEKVKQKNAQGWANADPNPQGFLSMSRSRPGVT